VLGRLLSRHPKHARDAVAALEKAAQLGPQTLSHHVELVSVLAAQGLKIRARKALEPALKLAAQDQNVIRLASELGMLEPPEPEKPKGGVAGLRSLFGKKG
jgi:cytochrome c-type biogenesis protein CcmH/NrfG